MMRKGTVEIYFARVGRVSVPCYWTDSGLFAIHRSHERLLSEKGEPVPRKDAWTMTHKPTSLNFLNLLACKKNSLVRLVNMLEMSGVEMQKGAFQSMTWTEQEKQVIVAIVQAWKDEQGIKA